MEKTSGPRPVKLIVGLIFKEAGPLDQAKKALKKRFGKTDFESQVLDFGYTDYYEKEFGTGLKRQFLSFQRLINPQDIARIKVLTNQLEIRLATRPKNHKKSPGNTHRTVNIDPGYLELSKLILATTKDFSHRIYLKNGIFAEVTLMYRKDSFQPLEWTYPDYRTTEYLAIFDQIRHIYSTQKQVRGPF